MGALERETGFAGAVGDPGDPGALADQLPDLLGGVDRTGRALERLLHRRRRCERGAADVVDDLGVDVLVRAEHREARARRGAADLLADAPVAAVPGDLTALHGALDSPALLG